MIVVHFIQKGHLVPEEEFLVYAGLCYSIEWGLSSTKECQARDYYHALNLSDRARTLALFKRMADVGKIYDTSKFTQETKKLYVFKPQPHRFFSFFFKGKRIIIVSAYRKQGQKAPSRELEHAEALMKAWLAKEASIERKQK
ncbi:MAG: type II toxin-antitoxin system RelE/ParE family toxin [Rectinemataceae bacterium]